MSQKIGTTQVNNSNLTTRKKTAEGETTRKKSLLWAYAHTWKPEDIEDSNFKWQIQAANIKCGADGRWQKFRNWASKLEINRQPACAPGKTTFGGRWISQYENANPLCFQNSNSIEIVCYSMSFNGISCCRAPTLADCPLFVSMRLSAINLPIKEMSFAALFRFFSLRTPPFLLKFPQLITEVLCMRGTSVCSSLSNWLPLDCPNQLAV